MSYGGQFLINDRGRGTLKLLSNKKSKGQLKADNISDSVTYDNLSEAYYNKIISKEMKKSPKKRDYDLIDECIKNIAEIKGVKHEFSPDELKSKGQALIMSERIADGSVANSNVPGCKTDRPARVIPVRRALLIAAAAILTVCILTVTVVGMVYDDRFWFFKLFSMPAGSLLEDTENKITYIYPDVKKTYRNLEEFLKEEKYDILYPSVFPEDNKLESITYSVDEQFESIGFNFDSYEISYGVYLNLKDWTVPYHTDIYSINGYDVYYWYDEGTDCHGGIIIHNGYYHSMLIRDYDDFMLIINNLKGY